MTLSDDARIATAISSTDGTPRWTHEVPSDCAISRVSTGAPLAVEVGCVDGGMQTRYLDPDSGSITSIKPGDMFDQMRAGAPTERPGR